jgi:hypothetical protein
VIPAKSESLQPLDQNKEKACFTIREAGANSKRLDSDLSSG